MSPKIVCADFPDEGNMFYLIDENLDFIPEVKEFLDWKRATKRAPSTIKAYCSRLLWYYRFLHQQQLQVLQATPADLTEFVIWLCNPHRGQGNVSTIYEPSSLQATSVNLILQAVGSLYYFLVRRGALATSPVTYVDVPRGKWLTERDLLAHIRRGHGAQKTQRMELKLKEPSRLPKTVSEQDFQKFIESIHVGYEPGSDPSGFRNRLLCLLLKEGGFRIGELLGMRMDDLDFGKQGVHVRFRSDNENQARAKAGYGRDRFVHLPTDVLGLLDIYITEVWIEAAPKTDHLWLTLKRDAISQDGKEMYGAALTIPAVESMFRYYSTKSDVNLHPHMLRHTHATEVALSYLCEGQPVDWKFLQERLGHANVVTTMETYAHLTSEDFKPAYDAFVEKRNITRARRKTTIQPIS